MAEEVKVFRTWSSPFAFRVVWALQFKGVPYENIYEDLSEKSSLLLHYNPIHKKVPVLVHNGKPLAESLVILEYIEETWKQTPLFPEDPYERATARFWARFGDDQVLPSVFGVFIKQGKEREEAIVTAHGNLKYLEEELRGKKFFSGEKIGFLDLAFGWVANLVSVFEEIQGLTLIDHEKYPLLLAWIQNFMDDPIIKESWPPRDKLITKYQALLGSFIPKEAAEK
ncbi:probable glutathione S-transferase [Corylus avellana]|uniref:probable glutathione S-transferase n=1 Tax=Corylus avellana TaxID=13451 RepID=UPI00286B7C6E|nr:probable glutathione S-transferase [Corylus avellana]